MPGQPPCASTELTSPAHVGREPQPLNVFPELRRLRVHEPWLANPAVRVQCMWAHTGYGGARYKYFILSNGHLRTLGVLMREHELAYLRLYANYAFAAVDGTLWAGEIRDTPVRRVFTTGGVDRKRRCTWSVTVVQRERRYELQITSGGLIPLTRDFRQLEDALLCAEEWLTDLHHKNADIGGDEDAIDGDWLM